MTNLQTELSLSENAPLDNIGPKNKYDDLFSSSTEDESENKIK